VLVYFGNDWVRLIRAGAASIVERKIGADPDRRLAWFLLIGTIPGILVGALAESKVEEIFHAPHEPLAQWAVIAISLIMAFLGLLLFIAERVAKHIRSMSEIKLKDTVIIGIAQAAAIFPGVSRSGATLTAGLFLGLKRDDAARFSFLLGAIIIAGAGLKAVYDVATETAGGALTSFDLTLYVVGFAASALTGFLAIRFLLRYFRTNSTDIFVYYRWALSAFIIAVALIRG
jgi:undecaprenyl-diphosphatase